MILWSAELIEHDGKLHAKMADGSICPEPLCDAPTSDIALLRRDTIAGIRKNMHLILSQHMEDDGYGEAWKNEYGRDTATFNGVRVCMLLRNTTMNNECVIWNNGRDAVVTCAFNRIAYRPFCYTEGLMSRGMIRAIYNTDDPEELPIRIMARVLMQMGRGGFLYRGTELVRYIRLCGQYFVMHPDGFQVIRKWHSIITYTHASKNNKEIAGIWDMLASNNEDSIELGCTILSGLCPP